MSTWNSAPPKVTLHEYKVSPAFDTVVLPLPNAPFMSTARRARRVSRDNCLPTMGTENAPTRDASRSATVRRETDAGRLRSFMTAWRGKMEGGAENKQRRWRPHFYMALTGRQRSGQVDQDTLGRTALSASTARFSPFDEAMLASERRHSLIAFFSVAVDIELIVIADVRRKAWPTTELLQNCYIVYVGRQRQTAASRQPATLGALFDIFCHISGFSARFDVSACFVAPARKSLCNYLSGRPAKSRPVRYPLATRTLLRRMLINVPISERTARFQLTMLLLKDSGQLFFVVLLRDFRLFCLTFRRKQGRNCHSNSSI